MWLCGLCKGLKAELIFLALTVKQQLKKPLKTRPVC